MLKGTLIKTSLVDFPGRVAATYFLSGCNIRCPYCYNGELVLGQVPEADIEDIEAVFAHLEKRQNVLSGFVLSGGEPLLYKETAMMIQRAKALGYKVKLDTNGLLPEMLEELLSNAETSPDYVAMDIKTNPDNYSILKYSDNATEKLQQTIELLMQYPTEMREFRTVLCPPLVNLENIDKMANLLPKDARWFFAQFRNDNCLDERYNDIQPYSEVEIKKILNRAKDTIKESFLR